MVYSGKISVLLLCGAAIAYAEPNREENFELSAMEIGAEPSGEMGRGTTEQTGAIHSTEPSPDVEPSAELNEMAAMSEPSLIQNFVERMYTKALGRTADSSGVEYWTKNPEEGKATGASVGTNFFLSAEIQRLSLSDGEYLNRLYRTFMNREADTGERA